MGGERRRDGGRGEEEGEEEGREGKGARGGRPPFRKFLDLPLTYSSQWHLFGGMKLHENN